MANPSPSGESPPKRQGADDQAQFDGVGETRTYADETYDPSNVEATRGRMQGLGVGQTDLDRQRDPTGADSTEKKA